MLTAHLNDEPVFADEISDDDKYMCLCPACHEMVIPKVGTIVTPHFAHKPGGDCQRGIGESEDHLRAKYDFKKHLWPKFDFVRVEYRLSIPGQGHREVDVYVEHQDEKMAFELQKSYISEDDLIERVKDYERCGVSQIWITLPSKRLEPISSFHFQRLYLYEVKTKQLSLVLGNGITREQPLSKCTPYPVDGWIDFSPLYKHPLSKRQRTNETIFREAGMKAFPVCRDCGVASIAVVPVGYNKGNRYWSCLDCLHKNVGPLFDKNSLGQLI